jgi:CHAT domain-containing protein
MFTLENPLFFRNPAYPTNTKFPFPDLPGARKEINNAIPYARNYKLFEGKAAIKDSILRYLGGADLVYLTTHGIPGAISLMDKSFLVLSGSDPFLTTRDIMKARKDDNKFAEMVILLACQTGQGNTMEAGVAGMARSLMLAGYNHVFMSLWNADDVATVYLMNRFLFHLQKTFRFIPSQFYNRQYRVPGKNLPNLPNGLGFLY